jgi:hypothetical protein
MARTKKIKHIMTIGSDKYSFQHADTYGNFGSQFGISKAPANDTTVFAGKITGDSFSDGTAITVKARGVVTNSSGVITKAKDFSFIVPLEKAKSALAAIDSKTVTDGTSTYNLGNCRIPQRVRFS